MGANVSHLCSCESNFKVTEQNMVKIVKIRLMHPTAEMMKIKSNKKFQGEKN
jgi:hypothetical protein